MNHKVNATALIPLAVPCVAYLKDDALAIPIAALVLVPVPGKSGKTCVGSLVLIDGCWIVAEQHLDFSHISEGTAQPVPEVV